MLWEEVFHHFYPQETPLRALLLRHSEQVRDKALALLAAPQCPPFAIGRDTVVNGAMLHDIGISQCHAPSILCTGNRSYIEHGVIGGAMLRSYDTALEPYARICERHTGAGLTAEDIIAGGLPLPRRDFLPESDAEKLICLADKFFSKSGDMQEKPIERVIDGIRRFGVPALQRFTALCRMFGVSLPPEECPPRKEEVAPGAAAAPAAGGGN